MKSFLIKFWENNKKYILFCMVLGYLLYIPICYLVLWNPDSLSRRLYADGITWVEQARWASYLYEIFFRSQYIHPMTSFVVSVAILSVIPAIIFEIFDIKNNLAKILICFCVVTSMHQYNTMTYAYCCDEFTIAYFLNVAASYFLTRKTDSKKQKLFLYSGAIIFFVISLAMYQSYLAIALIILGTYFVCTIFDNENFLTTLRKFIAQIVTIAASIAVYLVSVKVSIAAFQVSLSSYRDIQNIGHMDFSEIPTIVKEAYTSFWNYYFTNQRFYNDFYGRKYCALLAILFIGILLVLLIIKKKKNFSLIKGIMLVAVIFVSPIAFNIVHFMTRSGVSFMMLPALPYLYIIMIIILDKYLTNGGKKALRLALVPSVIYVMSSILLIGIAISKMSIDQNQIISLANNLDYAIKSYEGFSPEKEILIYGVEDNGLYTDIAASQYNNVLIGTINGFGQLWNTDPVDDMACWNRIFRYYCGTTFKCCSKESAAIIYDSEEFKTMSYFPSAGSLKEINGVIVVKLSDSYDRGERRP